MSQRSIATSQRSTPALTPGAVFGRPPGPEEARLTQRAASVASSGSFNGDVRPEARRSGRLVEEEDQDMLSEVIMAVDVAKRGTVGCAYYVAREEKLYFMEDVQHGGADVVDQRESVARSLSGIATWLTLY